MADDNNTGAGTALGAVGTVALDLAPEISRWLFGPGAETTVKAVQAAIEDATGTPDPDRQLAALADPALAAKLRVQLASVAAACAAASDQATSAALVAALSDVSGARATTVQLTQAKSPMAWGAAVVSVVVLGTFTATLVLTLNHAISDKSAPVLNVLLGSLTAMATSVVSYWVGSSVGSFRKDSNIFAQQTKVNSQQ